MCFILTHVGHCWWYFLFLFLCASSFLFLSLGRWCPSSSTERPPLETSFGLSPGLEGLGLCLSTGEPTMEPCLVENLFAGETHSLCLIFSGSVHLYLHIYINAYLHLHIYLHIYINEYSHLHICNFFSYHFSMIMQQ